MVVLAAMRAISSAFSGGQGSSSQRGSNFPRRFGSRLETEGVLEEKPGGKLVFRDFGPSLSEGDELIRKRLLECLAATPFTPPSPTELAVAEKWDESTAEEIADLLSEEGSIVKIAKGLYFHQDAIQAAQDRIRAHLEEHGSMTASLAKDLLESTRKYCIPLLEHFDRSGFTIRQGDLRKLRK